MATAKKRETVATKTDSQTVSIDQHRLTLTHLDKVMYPATGTTKSEVIAYYAAVAPVMLPHIRDRAVTRKRWVNGVGTEKKPGMMFFQKNLDDSTPSWVRRRTIVHKDHCNEYPLVGDLATLTWLAQIAALEIHVPQWRFGRTGAQQNPDRLVLDLDPGPGIGLLECAEVARIARVILRGMGLDPMPVTSGSKGIHLYASLDGTQTSDQVTAVAHELARSLEADHADLIVSDMKKSLRDGKVLVDWSQNNANKTTVAPYSLRGRMRPTVAAPRTWRELASKELAHLEFEEVMARVAKRGDPLSALEGSASGHLEPSAEHMAQFESTPAARDRLAKYRSKRDASKTPEPVPARRAEPSSGQTFVIQEHHASRLHWDFRLEHDGVLVSWALPKGVPTDAQRNHLAVQTEDHPLEYGTFEGDIPQGEYGGGHVDIWDEGTYELEKWRDGEEVIATLHGTRHGSHKYALIHTGGEGKADQNWLIHLMKDQS
jgi:bifunctional non-homologous end joining protein LigD